MKPTKIRWFLRKLLPILPTLAIVLAVYRTFQESIDMEDATLLKG